MKIKELTEMEMGEAIDWLIANQSDFELMPLKDETEPVSEVPCSARVSCPAVDEDMLRRAMKKAVEVGIFPKWADEELYLKHWDGMKEVLQAAVGN